MPPAVEARQALLAAARSCLGAPFRHQGRDPATGLDCIGLILVAGRAIGLTLPEPQAYERRPQGHSLLTLLRRHLAEVSPAPEAALPGDLLLFAVEGLPAHCALLLSPQRILHADARARAVVESGFEPQACIAGFSLLDPR